MSFTPLLWDAVVVGAWNPAILTPNGVKTRLFQLSQETPITVELNIESPQTFRVRHDGLCVTIDAGALIVSADNPNLDELARAVGVLCRAVESLDQTPVSAAGINFRFVSAESERINAMVRTPLDEKLTEQRTMLGGTVRRSLQQNEDGVLNLDVTQEKDQVTLTLNYHRNSADCRDLAAWLRQVAEFHTEALGLLGFLEIELGV